MTALERSLKQVTAFFEQERIPYMFIGGIANLIWGQPRLTRDLDVTILCRESEIPALVERLKSSFQLLVRDPLGFIKQTNVLPLTTRDGVRVDVVFARLPYEEHALARATIVKLGKQQFRVCTAEDLVVHKIISERPRDLEDVRHIIVRQRDNLDRDYLDPLVRELSRLLARPEIWAYYLQCWSE